VRLLSHVVRTLTVLSRSVPVSADLQLSAHRALHRTQQMHRELGQMNVRKLLRQLEDESTAATLVTSRALAATRELESDEEDDERTRLRKRRQRKERLVKRLDEQEAREKSSAKNKQLWVDKYAPKGYGDLLSPEVRNGVRLSHTNNHLVLLI
jgi:Mg-chelatase subunit ChlI